MHSKAWDCKRHGHSVRRRDVRDMDALGSDEGREFDRLRRMRGLREALK
jgi:hypothetical protein